MSQYSKFYLGTGAAPIEHISVGGGTVDPDGTGTITITNGANITWTAGVSTMQADVTGTTDHAVQVGNATGSLTSLGLGLNNQFLRGNTGADPSWNAVDLTTDVTGVLPVGSGGTGVSSVTAHNLLVGDGTNALNEITAGTNGQFLLGVTGADAVFGTSADGNFTFTTATSGTDRTLAVTNTDNTGAAASHAHVHIQTNSASAGDPYVRFDVSGGQDYSLGVDNSSSDALLITDDTNPSTGNTLWKMTSAGESTMPLQPAFLAYNSVTDANVTGNGAAYTVEFNTEVFDQNGDYNNTTDTLTAPVTAKYHLSSCVKMASITNAGRVYIYINTSNRNYSSAELSPKDVVSSSGYVQLIVTALADMDAADTAKVIIVSTGEGANTNSVFGIGSPSTYFCGNLAC